MSWIEQLTLWLTLATGQYEHKAITKVLAAKMAKNRPVKY